MPDDKLWNVVNWVGSLCISTGVVGVSNACKNQAEAYTLHAFPKRKVVLFFYNNQREWVVDQKTLFDGSAHLPEKKARQF